ncbi:hypothetical protein SAMN04489740_2323 [Arthrobacter alpinus]|uniref:Uncharacterized protein n=1 Tax=Arthrobacter alpinus TaxID=656366 RepID=A0A1H5L8B0_9MICC|nr:hypothetical protein [Arthrobacter alpinus]SEE72561.1 hypothetical protein SAMN04489740_2323 [Arthrobacter alpinus]
MPLTRSAARPGLPRRSTDFVVLLIALFALTGCITVPVGGGTPTASQGPTAAPGYVDRLKATPVGQATEGAMTTELPQFVTDSRNIACVFTASKAGNLNQPWEPNNFADSAIAPAPSIPVVNCQMVQYPQVNDADQADNCAGTNVGYLGGTAVLYPDKAIYGSCRAGVTAVEAAFGPQGAVSQEMASVPVLAPGIAMEAQGYRCAPLDDGVACANLASGIGFFIAAQKYEIFGP